MTERALALFAFVAIGFGVGRLVLDRLERQHATPFAVTTLAGWGLLAAILSNLSVLGIPFEVLRYGTWIAALAGCVLAGRRRPRLPALPDVAVTLLVLAALVIPLRLALTAPLLAHDALLIWWPKVEEVLRGVSPTIEHIAPAGASVDHAHPEYPRGSAWLAALVGPLIAGDPGWLKLQSLAFTAMMGLAVARPGGALRSHLILPLAAISLLLLPDVATWSHSGLQDLPLAALILLGALGFARGPTSAGRVLVVAGALGAASIKEEGAVILGACLLLLVVDLVRRREGRGPTLLALAALALAFPWWRLRSEVEGGVLETLPIVLAEPTRLLARIEALLYGLGRFAVDPGSLVHAGEASTDMALSWAAWLVPACLLLLLPRGPRPVIVMPAVLLLLADLAVYVGTPNQLDWHLRTSLGRLLLQVLPVLWVAVAARAVASPARPARPPEAPA